MSFLEKYTKGWSFRTTHPSFETGEEISVFITGYDGATPVARVGDTILRIADAPNDPQDKRVRVRISEFDESDSTGEADYLETVGESAF